MDNKDYLYRFFGFRQVFKLIKDKAKAENEVRLKKDKTTSENFRVAGNKFYTQANHDHDLHTNTLIQYNKSIAFAPPDSEELALGFSNRSALLLHLHRYKECLIDIDRASEITKSEQLKSKLQSRKERCSLMQLNADEKSIKESLGKLNIEDGKITDLELPHVKSKKIPCAADCVRIESDKNYKRQLTATRDIKLGEIVIIEKAYACSPSKTQIYLICCHCLDFAWNGIPCDFCVNSIYCSEICRKEAWSEYHDYECSILSSMISFSGAKLGREPGLDKGWLRAMILLARIFIKAVKAEGFESIMNETKLIDDGMLDSFSDGSFQSNKFGYVYSLRCRPQDRITDFNACTDEALVIYLLIKHTNLIPVANKLKNCSSADEKLLIRLRDILRKLGSIIELNMIRYAGLQCKKHDDSVPSSKGAVVVPCSSVINHSCVPNLSKLPLPQTNIIVYATKPIKKGEQLSLSYGPKFHMDIEKRKCRLKEDFDYLCRCLACKNNQIFQKINKKTGPSNYVKVRIEFEQIFGGNSHMHSMGFFTNPFATEQWNIFTRASLDQVFKLIELYFKFYEYEQACSVTYLFDTYMNIAFAVLYGDKGVMMNHC